MPRSSQKHHSGPVGFHRDDHAFLGRNALMPPPGHEETGHEGASVLTLRWALISGQRYTEFHPTFLVPRSSRAPRLEPEGFSRDELSFLVNYFPISHLFSWFPGAPRNYALSQSAYLKMSTHSWANVFWFSLYFPAAPRHPMSSNFWAIIFWFLACSLASLALPRTPSVASVLGQK